MRYSEKSITPQICIEALKNDSELGAANFIDKLHAMHPEIEEKFIFLQRPFSVKRGEEYVALSINDIYFLRKRLASWYHHLGVREGDIVTLCLTDGVGPFIHYLALVSLGAVASIINPRMSTEMAKQYMSENLFNLLIIDDTVTEVSLFVAEMLVNRPAQMTIINCLDQNAGNQEMESLPLNWPISPADSTLIMLSHTSGTTGVSKAVRFEHRQFFMGKRARLGRFTESLEERFLSALPQSHSSAISHLETAVLHGIPTYVLSEPTGCAPRLAIKEFRPTTVAAFPQTYVSLIQEGVLKNEFPSVRRWFSMGDAMHKEHMRIILNASPSARFIDAFGSSELGMALFCKVSTQSKLTANRCVGRPVDICVAKILDRETGRECPEDVVGLIGVRSPTITSGYWMKDKLTEESWKNGYFLTGDIGFRRDGEYYLIDRVADHINIDGAALYTLFLEEKLQELEGVIDASVVAIESRSGLFVTALLEAGSSIKETIRKKIQMLIKEEYNGNAIKNTVIALTEDPAAIPKGATGKVLKRQLKLHGEKIMSGEIESEFSKNIMLMSFGRDMDLSEAQLS